MPILNPDGYVVCYNDITRILDTTLTLYLTLKPTLVHLDYRQAVEKEPQERKGVRWC